MREYGVVAFTLTVHTSTCRIILSPSTQLNMSPAQNMRFFDRVMRFALRLLDTLDNCEVQVSLFRMNRSSRLFKDCNKRALSPP